jgi:hypothetical protein
LHQNVKEEKKGPVIKEKFIKEYKKEHRRLNKDIALNPESENDMKNIA